MSGAAALPLASSFPRAVVLVEVTAADIRRGTPCETHHCPLAWALDRVLIDGLGIGIEDQDIIFWSVQGYQDEQPHKDPLLWAVALPDIARQFVADLDNQHEAGQPITVQPIRFELEVPAAYVAPAPKTTRSWEAPA